MTSQKVNKEPQGSRVFTQTKPVNKRPKYNELNRQLSKVTGEHHQIFIPGYN